MASLKELYNALKADGAPLPDTYDKFEAYMTSGPNGGYTHRKQVYDALKADGAPLPDTYEEFSKSLFTPKPQAPAASREAVTGATPVDDVKPEATSQPKSQQGWKPTAKQRAAMVSAAKRSVAQFNEKSEAMVQGTKNAVEYFKGGGAVTRQPVKGKLAVNEKTGKVEQTYLTPTGGVTTDKGSAERETRAYNEYVDNMTVAGQLRRALNEQKRLDDLMRKRREEIDSEKKSHPVRSFLRGMADESHGMPGGVVNDNGMRDYRLDEEYLQLESAARKNRQTIQTLSDKKNDKMDSFWHSLGSTMANGYTFSDGMAEINDALAIMSAQKHLSEINRKRKNGEALTREETAAEAVLSNTLRDNEIQGTIGGEYGAWARAGSMFSSSLDLMKDIMLTPGAGNIAKGIASSVSKGIGRGVEKTVGKVAGEKVAEKVAESMATRFVTKATGILIGAHAAGAVVSNTAGIGYTIGEFGKEAAGTVSEDGNGYVVSDKKGIAEALWDAERTRIRENGSEMFGEFIPGVGGVITKGMERIGLKRISSALTKMGGKEWYQQYSSLLKSGGYNGLPGEAIEEYEGYLFDILTGNGKEALNEFSDKKTHIDIWLGCATTGALLGSVPMVIHGGHTAMYYKYKHAASKSDGVASSVLGEKWEAIRDRIDGTPNEDMADVVNDLVSNENMGSSEISAVLDYVRNLTKMRGFNLAQMATSAEEGEKTPEEEEYENSYRDGYSATTAQEMNDAKRMLELQRGRLASSLGDDALTEYDEDPIGALSRTEDPELRRMAADYVNAKQVYDGMIQRVRDDVDARVAQSDAMIDSRVNRESGKIQPGTMKLNDRAVYIVDGNVAMYDDGTGVDIENSSESIIIRDAETGKVEFADPSQFLNVGEEIDAEAEKEAVRAQITQEVAQAAANNIDGVLSFAPGESYPVLDLDGNEEPVTILGQPTDENGMPLEGFVDIQYADGSIQSVAMSDLQQWVDAANDKRVAQFAEERAAERAAADEAEAQGESGEYGEISLTLPENQAEYGNGSEQDNDGLSAGDDSSRMATDATGVVEGDRDRSDIRVYEEGLASGDNAYSEHSERTRRNQEGERLIGVAKQNGQYLDRKEVLSLGIRYSKGTGESDVTIDQKNGRVYKVKNPYAKSPMKGGVQPEDAIYEHLVHNKYFPETRYQFEGISEDLGEVRIVLSQDFVKSVDNATDEQIEAALAQRGLYPEGNYRYGNDEISVTDVTGDNALLGADGNVYFIDPIIDFKKPVREIIGDIADEGMTPAEESEFSALSQIPTDEHGEPMYGEDDADLAWDALMEETEDEQIAQNVIAREISELEGERKKIEKQKPKAGLTTREKIDDEKAKKRAIDDIQRRIDHWKRMGTTRQRRQAEAEARRKEEARRRAEELRAREEQARAEREEAERMEREALKGVPDWSHDTPQNARARGYRRNGSEKVDRPEIIADYAMGDQVEVKFGDDVMPQGRIAIIEASQLQPSHRDGQRNPLHFLDEAQPKERKDAASRQAAAKIAKNIRPKEITTSVTAYTGAPNVNSRGEVIQGNNRSEALRIMYEREGESARIYKQYLIDHAEEFGVTPEGVAAFENPVLVNMLDVADDEAIRLGQFVSQDTESGGIERIKPRNAVKKMGSHVRSFVNRLLRSSDEEASLSQLVETNGGEVLRWMSEQGFINETQYGSAFDSKGNLTVKAAEDLKGILYQSIFNGGSTRLEELFNMLPVKAQRAILATAFRDYDSKESDRMVKEIQQSILAFNDMMQYEVFATATNIREAMGAMESWKRQYAMDEATGETFLPGEKFSNFALVLAAMYKGGSQKFLQQTFNDLYDTIQGTAQDTLFEEADKTPRTLAEAIRKVLDIEYQPIKETNNERDDNSGSDAVDFDSPQGEAGGPGGNGNAGGGELEPGGKRSADSGAGTSGDSGRSGNIGNGRESEAATQQERLTKEAASGIIAAMELRATVAPELELTIENWDALFGTNGIVSTPIGDVKMGENQFTKLMRQGRNGKLGMIKPTLENPDIIIEDSSESKDADTTERASSYVFVKTFVKPDGSRFYYFTSVTVSKEGHEVVVSNQEKRRNVLTNLLMKGKLVWKHADNVSPASDVADGLYSPQGKMSDPASEGTDAPQTNNAFSDHKGSDSLTDKQEDVEESSLGARISEAEKDVAGAILSEQEAADILAKMEMSAVNDPKIPLTPESWQQTFGLGNSIETPLGKVKMGEGQYQKLIDKKRTSEFGMVAQTLRDPDIVLIEPSKAKEGTSTERNFSYIFVKTFVRDGSNIKYYTSVSVLIDGMEVSVSSHIANKSAIMKKLQSMERAYTKESLLPNSSEWHLAEHPTDVPDLLPTQGKSDSSDSKDNTLSPDKQEDVEESSLGAQISEAEKDVDPSPTDKQKEAGNYKKGHVQVGTFDVTIENPKGSKRSGTDADGKRWETTMTHTYGYILGTKGVDGDHIDVFLSSEIDDWNGRKVFVVDQYNPDESFDEHKVMLGFNDRDEAFAAYLSNYEAGWEKGRRLDITAVPVEEFEKWI